VAEILGNEKVTGIKFKSQITNNKSQANSNDQNSNYQIGEMAVDGVFVAIGHAPASELFKGKIETDEKGFIVRGKDANYRTMTNIAGVFVAGDVHDSKYKQAITAAGYGCEAALEIEKWVEGN
jgi:thioredoxin reductase (NADPH)